MNRSDAPPWRQRQQAANRRPPPSTVPRKRAANEDEDRWVAEEDQFVLRQAKKKAAIRVRSGRAKPIDWLAVILRLVDPVKNPIDEDEEGELDAVDPEGVFEGLGRQELEELMKDIDTYLTLELEKSNRDFWSMMKVICTDRLEKFKAPARTARGVESVASDFDRILAPKTLEQLETLEKQVHGKLKSNDPSLDVEYWEHLLRTLLTYKAKARLRNVSQAIVKNRLDALRRQQEEEANKARQKYQAVPVDDSNEKSRGAELDPKPLLKIPDEEKALKVKDERDFLKRIEEERKKILKLGYVPAGRKATEDFTAEASPGGFASPSEGNQSPQAVFQALKNVHLDEDEEVFAAEEEVNTASTAAWAGKYQPRKPQYFNRVQMGYEWNKYNQTHYDKENPPPKVVQGYKFNIFYPDLIDKRRAPTYRIIREGGRKRNQSYAPAGEDDSCLIRFIAGPPYEDIAFRIVDKEWDYSAKRERGFKSSFENVSLVQHDE
jgi:Conserved mid region of cactin/Cactus-binding C-terminus of cactin protein